MVERRVIKKSNKLYEELDNLCFLSKNLYNATLYSVRQHFFETGNYLNYNAVNKEFTHNNQVDYRLLPAKVSKMTQMLVDKSFKSFFALKKKGDVKARPPKYLKKDGRQVVQYTKQALSFKVKGYVRLSGTNVYIKTKHSDVRFVRVTPKNQYVVVEVGYEVGEPILVSNDKISAIDLGVNNLATLTSNVRSPLILNGRPLKAINQYYNKKLAELKSDLDLKGKKTSNRLNRLHFKRNNKVNDYMHKASRYIVNQLVSNEITTLVIGYNKGWKQDINLSKVNNQNFTQIPFLRFVEMLEYKCGLMGIQVVRQEESYTSKCSFIDNEPIRKQKEYRGSRVKRGLFKSNGGKLINADANGSYNILKKWLIKQEAWNEKIFSDCVEVYSTPIVTTINS